MKGRHFAAGAGVLLGAMLGGATALSQTQPAARGPALDGSPAWFLQGSFPDPGGRTIVEPGGRVTVPARGGGARGTAVPASPAVDGRGTAEAVPSVLAAVDTPACRRSPLCGKRSGISRQSLQRVQWEQTMGYAFTYPYVLPA